MDSTNDYSKLLIGACLGVAGTIVTNLISGASSRFWKRLDHRKHVRNELGRYRRLLENTESTRDASMTLYSLKDFLLKDGKLLDQPRLREFFDVWLRDQLLDAQQEHSRLLTHESLPELRKLQADAIMLTA